MFMIWDSNAGGQTTFFDCILNTMVWLWYIVKLWSLWSLGSTYIIPFSFSGEKENQDAFGKHFERELGQYTRLCVVNVVDQAGKEKVIADGFLNHMVQLNHEQLAYVAFDFHEYWSVTTFTFILLLVIFFYSLNST